MNIDQLTAKFAQAYVKRSADTYAGQSVAPLSPKDVTAGVAGAQNAPAYYAGLNPSTAETAGQPFQVQTGPTGVMSGAPELLARPIETQQSYGSGAFYNPLNAGFYSPYLDVPFVGDDQSGFGLGGAAATGAGAYGATKGFLNRGLLSPGSYIPGLPRTPANMTPQAAADFYLRSLGADPQAVTPELGKGKDNFPLTATQRGLAGKATSPTMNPAELATSMATLDMPGPGVNPPGSTSNAPVRIVATNSGTGKGAPPVQTAATLNPHTPLVSPSGRPTAAGFRRAFAPSRGSFGGVPTGPRGGFRSRAPMYAALAGFGTPFLFDAYNALTAPEDPTGVPFSGFAPRVGYDPAVLGAEDGFFGDTPMLYEDVIGEDIPYGQR